MPVPSVGGDIVVAPSHTRRPCRRRLCGCIRKGARSACIASSRPTTSFIISVSWPSQSTASMRSFAIMKVSLPSTRTYAVGHVGIDAEGNVAGQRPWRGGPGQEVGVLLIGHPEADGGGGLLDLLIALSYLVAGEGGAAAGAVGDDLVALVEKALFVDGLQRSTTQTLYSRCHR